MRVCPKCGFQEPEEWKPTTWKSCQFIDCIRTCEIERIDPQLLSKIKNVFPNDYAEEEHYVYKISKTKAWILRRWKPIYLIQGWKDIPAEKKRIPHDLKQRKLLEVVNNES